VGTAHRPMLETPRDGSLIVKMGCCSRLTC
jgi:hypothetical protein